MSLRIVIDTNVYVSRALRIGSVPAAAVNRAWLEATTLLSTATWTELQAVLKRSKFARYIQLQPLNHTLRRSGQSLLSSPFRLPSASAAIQGTTSFWRLPCMAAPMS